MRARKRIHANRRRRLNRLQLDRSRPAVAPRRNIRVPRENNRLAIVARRVIVPVCFVMVWPKTKRPRRNTVFLIQKYTLDKFIRL